MIRRVVNIIAAGCAVFFIAFFIRHFICDTKNYSYDVNEFEYSETNVQSPETILRRGNYVIHVSYSAKEDVSYVAWADTAYENYGTAARGSNRTLDIPVCLASDTTAFYFKFMCPGPGVLRLHSVNIEADTFMYTDDLFFCVLCVAAFGAVAVLGRRWKSMRPVQKQVIGILAIGFAVASVIDYEPIVRFGTDIRVHLLRIEGIKDGILDGQFPVILFPNAFNGHGEIGCMYPSVFLYPAAILRLMGVSLLTCYKTMQFMVTASTLVITYMATRYICVDERTCAVISLLYTLFPYRMYVMGFSSSSLGRGISMIFFPLVVAGLYTIFEKEENWSILAFGVTGALWSHILNFVIVLLFLLFVCLAWLKKLNKKKLILLTKAMLVSFLVSLGVIVPFIRYYFSGLNLGYLQFDIYDKLFSLKEFMVSPWNLTAFFYIFCAAVVFFKNRLWKNGIKGYVFCLVIIMTIFYMCTTAFPWYIALRLQGLDKLLSTFQNLKRFYYIVSYLIPLMTCFIILDMCNEKRKRTIWTVVLVLAAVIGSVPPCLDYFKCEELMDRVTGYTDHEQMEYLPEGTVQEYYRSNAVILSDEENIEGKNYRKTGSQIDFDYTSAVENAYIELPVFYYAGYAASDQDGKPYRIEKGDRNHVRIYLNEADEFQHVHLEFYVSRIFQAAVGFSALICAVFLCRWIYYRV